MARALCWTALWDSARDAVTPAVPLRRRRPALRARRTGHRRPPQRAGQCLDGGRTLRAPGPARCRAPRLPHHGRRTAAGGGAGLRPAIGLGPDPCRDQPLRRRPAGPAPGHPGRQHRDRGPRGGRRTALESLACPGRQRPGLAGAARPGARPGQHGGRQVRARHGPRRPPRGVRQGGRLGGRRPRHGAVQPAPRAPPSPGSTPAPASLLAGFIDPYFESLEQVWADRSIEIASRIVRGFYPAGTGPGRPRRNARRPTP